MKPLFCYVMRHYFLSFFSTEVSRSQVLTNKSGEQHEMVNGRMFILWTIYSKLVHEKLKNSLATHQRLEISWSMHSHMDEMFSVRSCGLVTALFWCTSSNRARFGTVENLVLHSVMVDRAARRLSQRSMLIRQPRLTVIWLAAVMPSTSEPAPCSLSLSLSSVILSSHGPDTRKHKWCQSLARSYL